MLRFKNIKIKHFLDYRNSKPLVGQRNPRYSNAGFAAFLMVILVLVTMIAVAISITGLVISEHKISRNIIKSTQAYYAAEAGIEDMLLRLITGMNSSAPYNLVLGDSSTTVTMTGVIGGARTITSEGSSLNRIRKTQVVYEITADSGSPFYYGVQIGDGGMIMGNESRVRGNVFSNGSVVGGPGSIIESSITVASNGNKIDGLEVWEDALVHTCVDSEIGGTLTYVDVDGGSPGDCTAEVSIESQPNEIEPEGFPIAQGQIDEWKIDAAAGGTINNDVLIEGELNFLGPIQIGTIEEPKNLTVGNGAFLIVTGTIYVTGNIHFDNGSTVELNSGYGSTSGIIIAEGEIIADPNVVLNGSGQEGSYILILSEKGDPDSSTAIYIKNNAIGAIFYADSGLIHLENQIEAREVTGYKVQIDPTAIIEYESGLASISFSSGPGGGWQVTSWEEIE